MFFEVVRSHFIQQPTVLNKQIYDGNYDEILPQTWYVHESDCWLTDWLTVYPSTGLRYAEIRHRTTVERKLKLIVP